MLSQDLARTLCKGVGQVHEGGEVNEWMSVDAFWLWGKA